MPPILTREQHERLSLMIKAFNHYILPAGDFRTELRTLGFEDWEIDELIEDRDADEP